MSNTQNEALSEQSPQNIDKRGVYLVMDSPPAAHPLAVEGGGDIDLLNEVLDRYLTLEEIDVLLNELRTVANKRRERGDYDRY